MVLQVSVFNRIPIPKIYKWKHNESRLEWNVA